MAHVTDHTGPVTCVSFELAHCFYTLLNLCFFQVRQEGRGSIFERGMS